VVDPAQLAVGRDELDGRERVRLEAVLARQPAEAAAERVAGDADVARGSVEGGQAVLGGAVGDRGPADARANACAARSDVDPDLLERVRAHEERVLEPVDRAGVVAGRLRRDAQAALGGVADGLGDVVGVRHADERGGPLVVGQVEGLAGGIPDLVALSEDLAMDAGLKFREAP
jgi:hypothetical protein